MLIKNLMKSYVRRLSHVYRYSSIPTIRKESVAEHTAYVALYCLVVAKDLIKQGHEVDIGKLLEKSLVHDLDESSTGDFLRHVKYGHPELKRILDEVSLSMMKDLEDQVGVDLVSSWSTAKCEGIEGDILEVVDLFQVISYVTEEVDLGNLHVLHILPECCSFISKVIEDKSDSPVVPYARDILEWTRSFYSERMARWTST